MIKYNVKVLIWEPSSKGRNYLSFKGEVLRFSSIPEARAYIKTMGPLYYEDGTVFEVIPPGISGKIETYKVWEGKVEKRSEFHEPIEWKFKKLKDILDLFEGPIEVRQDSLYSDKPDWWLKLNAEYLLEQIEGLENSSLKDSKRLKRLKERLGKLEEELGLPNAENMSAEDRAALLALLKRMKG